MSRFIYGKTKNCCKCYKLATNWNGWLIKSRDGVEAGFCDEHIPDKNDKKKLRGIYNKQMEVIES